MMPPTRIVCILDDGGRTIHQLAELLDRNDSCIFQEQDVDRFINMVAEIDPDLIVVPDASPLVEENLLSMLRLLTDNIIAVAIYGGGESVAGALLEDADLCVPRDMPERELLARLHAIERRCLPLTAFTA